MACAQPPAPAESLLIGPGDSLHIQVYDTPQLEQHPLVNDAGNAPLLFVGEIALLGMTPAQAAEAISARMIAGGLMRHPQVSVTIEHYATQDVSLLGQVAKPGNYPLSTPRSIFDVLSMAGGLTALADRNVIIRRHGSQPTTKTFFVANSADNQIVDDIKVYPGDTIVVAKLSFIYILGDVARPGGYPLASNDQPLTLLQLLANAGSANKTAVLSSAKLLRKSTTGYKVMPVDVARLEEGKLPDFSLEADDVLFIPFSYGKNFLLNGSAVAASVATAAVFVP
jgi:polysaccharide export outer membrane protein